MLEFSPHRVCIQITVPEEVCLEIKNTVGGKEIMVFNTRKGIKNNPVDTLLITHGDSMVEYTMSSTFLTHHPGVSE